MTNRESRATLAAVLLLPALACTAVAQDFGFILQTQWAIPERPIRALVFAPAGTWFVAAAGKNASLFELVPEGQPRKKGVLSASADIHGVAISPDGKSIALVDDSGALALFESTSLAPIANVPEAHKGQARAVTFTNDGSYVVTGGEDGKIRVWTPRGQAFADLSRGARHEGEVILVAPSPPGRRVISVGLDRQIILWQIDTQQALRPTKVESDVLSAAVGGDGKTLALGLQLLSGNRFRSAGSLAHSIKADDRVRLIDVESGTQVRDIQGERQDLEAVGVTPDGRFIASAGGGSEASVWNAANGSRITTIPFDEPVTALAFAPDGRWMIAGTRAGSLSLLRLSGVGPAIHLPTTPQQILIVIIEPTILIDERDTGPAEVPRVETHSLRLQGRIKSSSALKSLIVGGQEITSLLPDGNGNFVFNAYVPLKEPGRHRIEIVAENEQGAVGNRAFLVERVARVETPSVGPGRRIALIVGVSSYADSSVDLQYANADAKALYSMLTNPALGPAAFRKDDVRILLDKEATVANINRGLREFLRRARENDFVLFFFAGHGAPDPNKLQDLYLLAHDTDPKDIAGTGILMRHVREAIAEIPARDILILTDSCHSAGIAAPPSMRSLIANPIHQIFLEKMLHASGGLAILTASEAAQVSYENTKWDNHGVFTYFLLQGLKGSADADGDRIVSLGELMEFVRDRVRDATKSRQIPAIGSTSFDRQLPLVIVAPEGAHSEPN